MVWHDMIWCNTVWYDIRHMTWYDMLWYDRYLYTHIYIYTRHITSYHTTSHHTIQHHIIPGTRYVCIYIYVYLISYTVYRWWNTVVCFGRSIMTSSIKTSHTKWGSTGQASLVSTIQSCWERSIILTGFGANVTQIWVWKLCFLSMTQNPLIVTDTDYKEVDIHVLHGNTLCTGSLSSKTLTHLFSSISSQPQSMGWWLLGVAPLLSQFGIIVHGLGIPDFFLIFLCSLTCATHVAGKEVESVAF
jgi:hypothetical protein